MQKVRIMSTRARLTAACLFALLLTGAPASGQQTECIATGSPEEIVKGLLEKSRAEIRAFNSAGGKPEDPSHPALRWSEIFWQCRAAYPDTAAASDATAEAVHILIHAAHAPRALDLADSVPPDDPAWEKLLPLVHEAATQANDFRRCVRRIEGLLHEWKDTKLRARAQLALADAHIKLDQKDQAVAWFETVQREAPGTPFADRAAGALHELRALQPGQAAPAFEGKARDGSMVSLAGYCGRAVVLIFWSST